MSAPVPNKPSSEPIHWWLLAGLTGVLAIIWLLPGFESLKQSEAVFSAGMHAALESFSIVVAIMVFAVSWHTYERERPSNFSILACGFLAVGLLDFAHAMSYKGMPDFFTPAAPEKAIDFWLAARFISALTLLVIALRPWQAFQELRSRYWLLAASLLMTAAVYYLQLQVPQIWPRTFIEGQGLTYFKVGAELAVVVILTLAAISFLRLLKHSENPIAAGMFNAAVITILSELCFTQYRNVNDLFSLAGHLYKVLAYIMIYRVVFVSCVRDPYKRLSIEMAERKVAEARIEYLAYYDELTGLPNRVLLRNKFEDALATGRLSQQSFALIYLDIDGFNTINDSLGHVVGDGLLKELAHRLTACAGKQDTVGRLGSDEFLMVAVAIADVQACQARLASILDAARVPFNIDGHEVLISLSIGVALYPNDGDSYETLLKKADAALRRVKSTGRNAFLFFNQSMSDEASNRLQLLNGLRRAVERGELALHYQPQIDLNSGALVGAEALLRWTNPELGGAVSPARFIPVAEQSGLIIPIGDWVLQQACQQAKAWSGQMPDNFVVAVNLSAVQFHRGNVDKTIMAMMTGLGLNPAAIELELTESTLIEDPEQVLTTILRLKDLGIRLAIDDFGTGYSSLSYLRRFAVHKLKIDQSFVRELAADTERDAIVRTIIQMAKSLGLRTIAEGVETAEVAQQLRDMGCDEGQGYYFARPMPAQDFDAFRVSYEGAHEQRSAVWK